MKAISTPTRKSTTESVTQPTSPSTTPSLSPAATLAARLSVGSAIVFLALVALLHFLKPELDPSWRMLSEYAIGAYGWVMTAAFLALALSSLSLAAAARPRLHTLGGYIGLAVLLVSAAGTLIAAFNAMDPLTAGPDELTRHGSLHGLGAMLGIPTFPLAAVLISRSLAGRPGSSPRRGRLLFTAGLTVVGLVLMFGSLLVMLGQSGGQFGPDVLIGWPNRLLVVTYCAWLITAGRFVER